MVAFAVPRFSPAARVFPGLPLVLALAFVLAACAPASAPPPVASVATFAPVERFGDWASFVDRSASPPRCWAATHAFRPTAAREIDIAQTLVVTAEPVTSIVLPADAPRAGLILETDGGRLALEVRDGTAFLADPAAETAAVALFRAGNGAVLEGPRGAVALFSLIGFTRSHAAAESLCAG